MMYARCSSTLRESITNGRKILLNYFGDDDKGSRNARKEKQGTTGTLFAEKMFNYFVLTEKLVNFNQFHLDNY